MVYINFFVIIVLILNELLFAPSKPITFRLINNKRVFSKLENNYSERIDTFFSDKAKRGLFNGVVLFADSGRIVYEKAFGYSNFRTKDSLKTNSIFQLASVSKQFTSYAIMYLKEMGKLSYDDDVKKFFPSFPYDGITIKRLLTHSSGLPEYMHFADTYWQNKDLTLRNNDVIEMLIRNKPELNFKPGARFLYCNTGYCILAAIISKVSAMPFDQFMETNIFKPLGMNDTFIYSNDLQLKNNRIALGHSAGRRLEPWFYQDGVVGDKDVYSTVNDLLIWDQALYNCQLIKQTTLEEAFLPEFTKSRSDKNYGFGWRIINKNDGAKIVYHGGWWKGYRSYFIRSLNDHKTMIILINTAAHIPFRLNILLDLFGITNTQDV